MSRTQVADLKVGDGLWVGFANTTRKPLIGMVTETAGTTVTVQSIQLDGDGAPIDDMAWVTQHDADLPQLRVGRKVLRPQPHYRRWADDPTALMGFGGEYQRGEQPAVPTGLTLDELVRHEDSIFVIGADLDTFQIGPRFVSAFYDWPNGRIVGQHVTVFGVDNGTLARLPFDQGSDKYRHQVTDGLTFKKVDEGVVWYGGRGSLGVGSSRRSSCHYSLYKGDVFAVETRVLQMAGLAN